VYVDGFRLALLSYATTSPATRVFASSKSSWYMIDEAKQNLMENCVSKGSGGAILVPREYLCPIATLPFLTRSALPKLRESTLVLYAYAIGSQFDFTMNYYMSKPYGINPATLVNAFAVGGLVNSSASANIAPTS